MLIDGRGSRSFERPSDIEKAHTIVNEVRLRPGSRTEGSKEPGLLPGSDSSPASQTTSQLGTETSHSQLESSTKCNHDAARLSLVGFLTYTFWKPLSPEDGVPLSAVVSLWLFVVFYVFGCLALFCNECQYLLSVLGYFGACLTSFIGYLTLVYQERSDWFKERHPALGRLCQRVTSLVFVNAFALLFSYFLGLPGKHAGEHWRETVERGLVWNMAVVHICGHLLISSLGYFWRTRTRARSGCVCVSTSEKGGGAVISVSL